MGAVFLVLILLALSIKAITLLDRENITPAESHAVSVDLDPDSQSPDSISGQQVAAMAVAIALADYGSVPTQPLTPMGRTLSPDTWLQSGRTRAMSSSGSLVRDRRI